MFAGAHREAKRIIPLLLAVCVVAVGAYFVGMNTVSQILRADAESVATRWSEYVVRISPTIQSVTEGTGSIDAATAAFLERQRPDAIEQYRVYDVEGDPRWKSGDETLVSDLARRPFMRSEAAADVIASGEPRAAIAAEQHGGETRRVSQIFLPLERQGRTIGVFEVIGDMTVQWRSLQHELENLFIQCLGLIVVAFMLPGFLYLRRSGQLESAAERLQRTAAYDELTGALNRSTFTKLVEHELGTAFSRDQAVAMHFIDLDRFKDVNDTRGHVVGDEVLSLAAARLRKLLGTRERLARLGGDEFAICQPYYRNNPHAATELAETIVRELGRPFELAEAKIQIGASVGYARYPRDGGTVSALVRAADIALYKAKESNRGIAIAFDPSMEMERQARQGIEFRLRDALAENGFELNFQPLYDAEDGGLRGFEALLRLNDEDGRPISPTKFIPVAEEIGLIGDIGAWVLRESCRTARDWPEPISVSVNLSPAQFQSHDMPDLIRTTLRETGLPAERLEIEVTESLLITETGKVFAELMAIKSMGVSIALDDFGTGYSSLSYLWQFPFDKLKVDKSFMTDLAVSGSKSREILSTIVALGRVLDLKITAEGVETEEQAEVLRNLECDLVQGFLYGRPMKAVDVAATLIQSAPLLEAVGDGRKAATA